MADHHTPSYYSIAFVFLLALFGVIFILVWAFYLNIGMLRIVGEYPFTVSLSLSSYYCENERDCSFELAPRDYTFRIEKSGYYDLTESVRVVRGDVVESKPSLRIIPFLREWNDDFVQLKGAVVSWGSVEGFAWSHDDSRAVYFSRSTLYFWDGEVSSVVASFSSVTSPSIIWEGGDTVAILNDSVVTLVDLKSKRKQRLFDSSLEVFGLKWNLDGTRLLVEALKNEQRVLLAFDVSQVEVFDFLWYEPLSGIVWSRSDRNTLLFLSRQEFSTDEPQSLSDVLEFAEGRSENVLRFYSLDLLSGKAEVVYRFEGDFEANRIFWNEGGLLIEDDKGGVREIVL